MKKRAHSQRQRFEEAAREIGADETGEAFEHAFKAIVPPKHRPASEAPKEKRPKRGGK